jgi:uncharacterized integral membrane protein
MESILKAIVRHFIMVLMSFVSLYIIALTFTAPFNYYSWSLDGRLIFAIIAHIVAAILHAYYLDRKSY